jgi:hypothetical protein
MIVNYLRNEMGVKKLGAHGESIGGLVATHLAKNKNLDFLCADRTFTSLSKVGEFSFGKSVAMLFRFITLWNDTISNDYLEAGCYKVITFDAKDEVIHMLGSLKCGITKTLMEKRLGLHTYLQPPQTKENYSFFSPYRFINGIKSFIFWIRREHYDIAMEKKMQKYSLLTRAQTLALYWALNRIIKLMPELSSVINFPNLRAQMNLAYDSFMKGQQESFSKARGPKLASNTILTASIGERIDTEQCSPTKVNDESSSFMGVSLDTTIDMSRTLFLDENYLMKSVAKPRYDYLFDENARSSNELLTFFVRVFSAFESLEAGGIYLTDAMGEDNSAQFESFKVKLEFKINYASISWLILKCGVRIIH